MKSTFSVPATLRPRFCINFIVTTSVVALCLFGCARGSQVATSDPTSTPAPTARPTAAPIPASTAAPTEAPTAPPELASIDPVSPGDPNPPIGSPNLARPLEAGLIPDRLELPTIELDTSVIELGWSTTSDLEGQVFSQWDVADNAAGWHKNSALFGDNGNMVLSGHNNIHGAVFRDLDRLKKGDVAILWADGHAIRYEIEQVLIVPEKYATPEQRQDNVAWIGPFTDDRLTLVSCWPRDDNSHRIIVVAHPLDNVGGSVG